MELARGKIFLLVRDIIPRCPNRNLLIFCHLSVNRQPQLSLPTVIETHQREELSSYDFY